MYIMYVHTTILYLITRNVAFSSFSGQGMQSVPEDGDGLDGSSVRVTRQNADRIRERASHGRARAEEQNGQRLYGHGQQKKERDFAVSLFQH